jgi:hypothetical protein
MVSLAVQRSTSITSECGDAACIGSGLTAAGDGAGLGFVNSARIEGCFFSGLAASASAAPVTDEAADVFCSALALAGLLFFEPEAAAGEAAAGEAAAGEAAAGEAAAGAFGSALALTFVPAAGDARFFLGTSEAGWPEAVAPAGDGEPAVAVPAGDLRFFGAAFLAAGGDMAEPAGMAGALAAASASALAFLAAANAAAAAATAVAAVSAAQRSTPAEALRGDGEKR